MNEWKTKTAGMLRKVLATSGFTYSQCGIAMVKVAGCGNYLIRLYLEPCE
jgi:hypothetical protein